MKESRSRTSPEVSSHQERISPRQPSRWTSETNCSVAFERAFIAVGNTSRGVSGSSLTSNSATSTARYVGGKSFIPILSCFEWSKQVLQHRSSLQLVHFLLAIDLLAAKAVITQLLYCPENLNVFATATAPFDKIDDIDMAAADGLF